MTAEQLAEKLGTTRRSLCTWGKMPGAPQDRDPQAWDGFMRANLLGHYSARLNAPPPPSKPHAQPPEVHPVIAPRWEDRRDILFELMETLHGAHADGALPLADYIEIGGETVALVARLSAVWKAGIDAKGFRRAWESVRAAAINRALPAARSLTRPREQ